MYLFPTLKHHRSIVNFIFVFPLLFTFAVTVIIPLCLGVFYSFTDWNGIRMNGFVGFANYKAMFGDASFLWSLLITILFVVLNMILINVVAFLLALLCTSNIKGISFFRASYFLPNLIGGIVLGYVWQFVFNNVLIKMTNNISLLSKTNTALMAIITYDITGFKRTDKSCLFYKNFLCFICCQPLKECFCCFYITIFINGKP